jgi:Escherichia/Staphylococcus phage prohead protease
MLTGFAHGGLELRRRSDGTARLQGRFPYGSRATLSDGGRTGRVRKEQFAPGAFRYSVEAEQEVHLLVGHSFDRPLASRGAGSLTLEDTPEALVFSASIAAEIMEVSYVRDALSALSAGLIVGISPGFRIPPQQTVPNAESVEEENPAEGRALIRTIHEAILFELSLVARPAYSETEIEARNWNPPAICKTGSYGFAASVNRWR